MFQGNWKCSTCGGAITELPFQPRSESGLTCRACYAKSKDNSGQSAPAAAEPEMMSATEAPEAPEYAAPATEPPPPPEMEGATPVNPGEKPKFAGSWQCASCGGEITSLPFEPRDTSNLKCLDCFKRSKE